MVLNLPTALGCSVSFTLSALVVRSLCGCVNACVCVWLCAGGPFQWDFHPFHRVDVKQHDVKESWYKELDSWKRPEFPTGDSENKLGWWEELGGRFLLFFSPRYFILCLFILIIHISL